MDFWLLGCLAVVCFDTNSAKAFYGASSLKERGLRREASGDSGQSHPGLKGTWGLLFTTRRLGRLHT